MLVDRAPGDSVSTRTNVWVVPVEVAPVDGHVAIDEEIVFDVVELVARQVVETVMGVVPPTV